MEQQEKEKSQGFLVTFGWVVFVFAVISVIFFVSSIINVTTPIP